MKATRPRRHYSSKTTKGTRSSRKQTDKALKQLLEAKTAALEVFARLHKPLEEAVYAELEATKVGKKLLWTHKELASKLAAAQKLAQEKKLSRAAAWKQVAPAIAALKEQMRAPLGAAYSKHAALFPNHRTMIEALYGDAAFEHKWLVEYTWLPFLLLLRAPAPGQMDVGVIQQGLGDPPPFGLCQAPPYALEETRIWTQLIGDAKADARPANGYILSDAFGDYKGGGAARALVGNDFAIPAGHTDFEVTADIDWRYSAWTFAVFGAAGVGADLLLVVDRDDGSSRHETFQPLFSLLSPVIWGNSATGTGSSKMSSTFSVTSSRTRTIRVFAGFSSHAEAAAAVASGANVLLSGTVKNICVSAT